MVSYWELREAYAKMLQEVLNAPFRWTWWVTLTSRTPMPLEILKKRFFWWLKILRKVIRHRIEHIWFVERQRRGVLHIHSIISDVPEDEKLWRAMIHLWETYWTRDREVKFGDATIKKYDQDKAGNLSWYLAKERCKDLDVLEGSGSLFEKFGYSRGVRKFLNTPDILKSVIWELPPGEDSYARTSLCPPGDRPAVVGASAGDSSPNQQTDIVAR